MRLIGIAVATLALSGCVSIDVQPPPMPRTNADATLAAIMRAEPRQCPTGSVQANARTSGETERIGVAETEIARTPLANGETAVRTRRLVIQPGGVLPWHAHAERQGMALIVSGTMTEYRNSCREPLVYRAGDVARETADLAHMWRNESRSEAVILAIDVVPAR